MSTDEPNPSSEHSDVQDTRNAFAAATGQEIDPMAQWDQMYRQQEQQGNCPFELFKTEILEPNEARPNTFNQYNAIFDQWREYMAEQGRHPACPNEHMARGFVPWLLDGQHSNGGENSEGTVESKLLCLSKVWRFFQDEGSLPAEHNNFNPFEKALEKSNLNEEIPPDPPFLTLDQVRDAVHSLPHLRQRGIAVTQLKLGMRRGEVANIRIEDVALSGPDIEAEYPSLGTHPELDGRTNCIYIPPADDEELPWPGRPGNKSRRSRIMPLDDEMRRTFRRLLLVRPRSPDDELFLSKKSHRAMQPDYVGEPIQKAFEPFNGDDRYRDITSHYGRHYFSTFWRNRGTNAEIVKYMRGDATSEDVDNRDALAHYIHTYYEDIEDLYRNNIYKLGV